MKCRLAVSLGEVADWERRDSSEEVIGHLVALRKQASRVRGPEYLGEGSLGRFWAG